MTEIADILISLIKNCIVGPNDRGIDYQSLSEEQLNALLNLAKKQSLLPIIVVELDKFSDSFQYSIKEKIRNAQFSSLYAHEKLVYELESICEVFEKEKIPYIKLKGSRIKAFYPEPWMRTSGDLDILVKEEDISRAIKVLVSRLKYYKKTENFHDISLYSQSGVLLELHFNIQEDINNLNIVLNKVWEYSSKNIDSYEYLQTEEFFIFHQIAHMAYHFINGGCGIRPFIDVYLLQRKMEYDEDKVRKLCKEASIETFYDAVLQLIDVWFGDTQHNTLTKMLEEFIMNGGTFGDQINKLSLKENNIKKEYQYLWKRLFVSYDILKISYPVLEKHRYLMPFCQIHRWYGFLKKRININSDKQNKKVKVDLDYVQTVGKLLDELDLK